MKTGNIDEHTNEYKNYLRVSVYIVGEEEKKIRRTYR